MMPSFELRRKESGIFLFFFNLFVSALFVCKIESVTNINRKSFHGVCGLGPYVFGDIDKLGDGFVSFITRPYFLGTYLAESLPVEQSLPPVSAVDL